jgi:glyoxylase-like metal-dependent hydrolase (beta-lactamase superfamily II)
MKITDGLFVIDGTNANVYVFKIGNKVFQVDSALKGQFGKIKSFYESNGLKPDIVLITHAHPDHIGELPKTVNLYSPKVYAHGLDLNVIRGEAKLPSKSFLTSMFSAFYRVAPVKDAEDTAKLTNDIAVIETPGHTPGSVSYLIELNGGKFIFVGDAAFEKDGGLYVNRKFSLDYYVAEASLKRIESLMPITVLPGHGKPVRLA